MTDLLIFLKFILVIKSGVVSQAKGSAYLELGKTKVIVSIFDPREIKNQNKYSNSGELYCDFKFSPFASIKRKPPQTDSDEKSLSLALMRALLPAVCRHEFPNFQVDIYANIIQDGGSCLSAAITCAGLALADAGIPMYDVVTAATVGILNDKILLDPTNMEEDLCLQGTDSEEHGIVTMARLSTHEQISELWQSGFMTLTTLKSVNQLLIESNKALVPIIKQNLVKKINKCIKMSADTSESDSTENKMDS